MSTKEKAETIRVGEFPLSYIYYKGKKHLTLILIHGHGGSKEHLRPIFNYPELAKYSILIPDLVGFGDTPAPIGFSFKMEDQAQAVKQLMDVLEIEGDIVLIPHSMGGPIGVMLAEMLRGRVKGIVYAEGVIDIGDEKIDEQIVTTQTLEQFKATGFKRRLDELRRDPEYAWVVPIQEKAGPVAGYMSRVDMVKVAKEDTLAGRLVNLKLPVLAVFGEKNKGLWTSEKKLAALFPLVYIPQAGHNMMGDNPDAFYAAVTEFINQL